MSKRRTRAFWEEAAARVAAGHSTAAVARQLGVRPKTLTWWCWRLKQDSASRPAVTPGFLPVVVRSPLPQGAAAQPAALEIAVAGVVLRVPVGADSEYVAEVAAALRARC